jgi:hypothetical protein
MCCTLHTFLLFMLCAWMSMECPIEYVLIVVTGDFIRGVFGWEWRYGIVNWESINNLLRAKLEQLCCDFIYHLQVPGKMGARPLDNPISLLCLPAVSESSVRYIWSGLTCQHCLRWMCVFVELGWTTRPSRGSSSRWLKLGSFTPRLPPHPSSGFACSVRTRSAEQPSISPTALLF